ncbi:MAG: ribose 5-phosphate isomerase B [Acidobacteriota bacterium]|nr:ribose 5-phosphate isomerase B [Acidobacteriota bacterium]
MAVIAIGSDHTGFKMKQEIINYFTSRGYQVKDFGCDTSDCVDYPDYAEKVATAVSEDNKCLGMLICGTGIGMSIAANKIKGVRAALCHTEYEAQMARNQFNANVLCVGARIMERDVVVRIAARFFRSEFEGSRQTKRLEKIERLAS